MIAVINVWHTAQTIANTNAIISDPISQMRNKGIGALLLILAGTTPSIDITMQVGITDTGSFYDPVDGNATALTISHTSVTASSWIQFSPVPAPYMKIVLTGSASNGADTTARAYLAFQE